MGDSLKRAGGKKGSGLGGFFAQIIAKANAAKDKTKYAKLGSKEGQKMAPGSIEAGIAGGGGAAVGVRRRNTRAGIERTYAGSRRGGGVG